MDKISFLYLLYSIEAVHVEEVIGRVVKEEKAVPPSSLLGGEPRQNSFCWVDTLITVVNSKLVHLEYILKLKFSFISH